MIQLAGNMVILVPEGQLNTATLVTISIHNPK